MDRRHVSVINMNDLASHYSIPTYRQRLEPFAPAHAISLNAINTEPAVMRFLGYTAPETMQQTNESIARVRLAWETLGYIWWSIVERATGLIVGSTCVQHVARDPCNEIEIAWRLATAATGQGYATEAGTAAARFAFDVVGADHVIAMALPENQASLRVMQRVGMQYRGIETHYDHSCTTYVLNKRDLA